MLSICEQLKEFTYSECYECSSAHRMDYMSDGTYTCEECYRSVDFKNCPVDMRFIQWREIKKYILNHSTPKKVIKIFIVKILLDELEKYNIDNIYDEFQSNYILFNH